MAEFSPNQQLEALMDRLAADVAPVQPLEDRPTLLVLAALALLFTPMRQVTDTAPAAR